MIAYLLPKTQHYILSLHKGKHLWCNLSKEDHHLLIHYIQNYVWEKKDAWEKEGEKIIKMQNFSLCFQVSCNILIIPRYEKIVLRTFPWVRGVSLSSLWPLRTQRSDGGHWKISVCISFFFLRLSLWGWPFGRVVKFARSALVAQDFAS